LKESGGFRSSLAATERISQILEETEADETASKAFTLLGYNADEIQEMTEFRNERKKDAEAMAALAQKSLMELIAVALDRTSSDEIGARALIRYRLREHCGDVNDVDLLQIARLIREDERAHLGRELLDFLMRCRGIRIGLQLDHELLNLARTPTNPDVSFYRCFCLSLRYWRLNKNPTWTDGSQAIEEAIELLLEGEVSQSASGRAPSRTQPRSRASPNVRALHLKMLEFLIGFEEMFTTEPLPDSYVGTFARVIAVPEMELAYKKILVETLHRMVHCHPPHNIDVDGLRILSEGFAHTELHSSAREMLAEVLSYMLKRLAVDCSNCVQIEQIAWLVRTGLAHTEVYDSQLEQSPFPTLAEEVLRITLEAEESKSPGQNKKK